MGSISHPHTRADTSHGRGGNPRPQIKHDNAHTHTHTHTHTRHMRHIWTCGQRSPLGEVARGTFDDSTLLNCPKVEERKRNAPTDERATSELTVADLTFSGLSDRRTPPKIMKYFRVENVRYKSDRDQTSHTHTNTHINVRTYKCARVLDLNKKPHVDGRDTREEEAFRHVTPSRRHAACYAVIRHTVGAMRQTKG